MEIHTLKVQTVLPLFGLAVDKEWILNIDLNDHLKPKDINDLSRAPLITCRFIPWGRENYLNKKNTLKQYLPNIVFPENFDRFDNLGDIAFSTPGKIDSFTYQAPIETHQFASCILLIDYIQDSPHQLIMMLPTLNSCDDLFIEPLLIAIRLIVGGEPYPYKGFKIWQNRLEDSIIKWPIMDLRYAPKLMSKEQFELIQQRAIRDLLYLRGLSNEKIGCRILIRALGYYHLASSIRDTRTSFMLHMIAIETLFKKNQKEDSNKAAKRMAYILAKDMSDKKFIYRLIDGKPGWFQLRNSIVHGDKEHVSHEKLDEMRECLRQSLIRIIGFLTTLPDPDNYHQELDILTYRIEQSFIQKNKGKLESNTQNSVF